MAVNRKSSPRKHSPQRVAASPSPPSTLRRSARVQKSATNKPLPKAASSATELLDAVRSLQEGPKRQTPAAKRPEKRVAFDEQAESVSESISKSHQPQKRSDRNTAQAVPTPLRIPGREHVAQGSPEHLQTETSHNESTFRRTSSLPPHRAKRLQELMSQEHLDEPKADVGLKRRFDAHATDGFPTGSTRAKRRREFKADLPQATGTLPSDPTIYMLSQLRNNPHSLTLNQISTILKTIQDQIMGSDDSSIKGFSQKYFDFTLNTAQSAAWPLHELRTKYIPLYMTTRWVADGSQDGWHNFFTQPHSRQYLVSAILGEWFTQRIFKHTAFGFPQVLVDALEDKDREYLHYDAIVRSKQRARMMKAWLDDHITLMRITESTDAAAENLADELLTMLYPLLPPPLFDPLQRPVVGSVNGRKDSVSIRKQQQQNEFYANIRCDLISLILDCTALHKAIRLTGGNGTIIRMVPHIQKGSRFHPTAPTVCVNTQHCNDTLPTDPDQKIELCIKMTCWPRVEATVPQGPDMAELAFREAEYRRDLKLFAKSASNKKKIRTDGGDDYDSSSSSSSDNEDHGGDDDDFFTWDDKDDLWPIVPDSLQDKEGRNPGVPNPDTNEISTIKRAAYVTLHPVLCPAKVYCEWTPQPHVPGQTLTDAVTLARRTHAQALSFRVEDLGIEVWNTWALYGGLAQWGILTTAAIVSVCRIFHIPTHIQNLMLKLVRGADGLTKAAAPLTVMPIRDIPGHLLEKLMGLVEELWLATGPFGTALATPVQTLITDPLKRIYEILRSLPTAATQFPEAGIEAEHVSSVVVNEAKSLANNITSILMSTSTASLLTGPVAPILDPNLPEASVETEHIPSIVVSETEHVPSVVVNETESLANNMTSILTSTSTASLLTATRVTRPIGPILNPNIPNPNAYKFYRPTHKTITAKDVTIRPRTADDEGGDETMTDAQPTTSSARGQGWLAAAVGAERQVLRWVGGVFARQNAG